MKRFTLTFSLILLMLTAAIAKPAQAENVVRWASQGDALTFDPMGQNEGPTIAALRQVYESLVGRGPDMGKVPLLATGWRVLDPKTWEFTLRKGVTFHDGTPFTARDVVFSFERAKSETSDFKNVIRSISHAVAVDDHTVHIKTSGPNPILPDQITTIFMMSEAWAKKHDVEKPQDFANNQETYAVRHANGTGPFKLELREPGVQTVMARNAAWWGNAEDAFKHNIEKIVYKPIKNAATRVAALLSGEIDFLLDPPLQDLKRIAATPGFKTAQAPQDRTIFLGMDQGAKELRASDVKGKNPLSDVRVRKAMYQAINIDAIKAKVMRGLSEPAGMVTAPVVHGHDKGLDKRFPYDVAAAKKLLSEAGYPDGFSLQLDCPNNRYINDEAICQAVTGMLGKIGIKVTLNAQPKAKHFPLIKKRETDFYMLGWGVPPLDSHYVFGGLMKSGANWAGINWNNPEADTLIDAIEVETDLTKRDAMIAKVWKMAVDDVIYLPLHHQVIVWAMKEKIDTPIFSDDSPRWRYARVK